MHTELLYQIALARTPHIGCVVAKTLLEQYGSAGQIFKEKQSFLARQEGIGPVRAKSIKSFSDFDACEKEIAFLEKHGITALYLTHPQYPKRLLHCYDSPTLLFYKGTADLNASKTAAVIGTRNNTAYGRDCVQELIAELAAHQVLIISGLAFGIDTLAHRDALKYGLPTVGVLAHGLQTIYPQENRGLARQILSSGGGLLTEFMSGAKPDKHHFPTRNRVVAGMADVTVVVETDIKGGSMITAELANNYHRDVVAFPGKASDEKSRGCNQLIKNHKAALVTGGKDVLSFMNWLPAQEKPKVQRSLFIELNPDEKKIFDLLNGTEGLHIDEINLRSQLTSSAAAAALLTLELQGVVASLPGKMYKLI